MVREVARTGWAVHARIRVHAPAEEVLARINPAVGTVEAVSDTESVLVTGGDSVEVVAVWIGMLGLDFSVTEPPALVDHLRVLAAPLREGDQATAGLLTVERRPAPPPAACGEHHHDVAELIPAHTAAQLIGLPSRTLPICRS